MITVISGTNRKGCRTRTVAEKAQKILESQVAGSTRIEFLALDEMSNNWFHNSMYEDYSQNFAKIQKDILAPSKKFLIVFPEYNGSYPGVLKMMIDASDLKSCFHYKSCAMIGVAAGRAGNLRGLDQLTNVMNHIKVDVMPHKLPISAVHTLINEVGELEDKGTIEAIEALTESLLKF